MRRGTKQHYAAHREGARAHLRARLAHYSGLYGLRYNKLFIRNTRSRWGSCSSRGNINFCYKVALLPPELCDYVVVHELCHLREFNHSPAFWALVAQTFPNYRALRRALRAVDRPTPLVQIYRATMRAMSHKKGGKGFVPGAMRPQAQRMQPAVRNRALRNNKKPAK